jgi:RHS repeat-associated protein
VNRANAQIDALGYAYDARGNLTRRTQNGVTTFLGNDEASLLTGTGTVSGSWTTTFGWDAAGFLRSSTSGLNMSYNAKRQTTIAQPDGSSAATALAYAGRDQTQPTREGDDEIAYDQLGAAKRTTPSGTTYYTRTPDGEVIGERTPSGRLFPARDRQGSVLGVTDGSGRLVRSLRYDPYGRVRADSGSGQTTYGYAGGERISGNKILRFGERFYSPELMRWTQPDPLDQPESLTEANPFAYAAGDPINNTDPTGRCVWKIPCPGVAKWVLKKFTVSCLVYRSVIVRYQLTRDGYGTLRRVPVSRVVPILTTCFEYMWVKP